MKHLYLYIIFLLMILPASGPASARAARYVCNNLRQLAATLENEYGLVCTQPQTVDFAGHSLVVDQDSLGRICHIGWRIFPEELMRENPSPVYRFVERYLLELYLYKDLPTPAQRLREDKVTLLFPGRKGEDIARNIVEQLPQVDKNSSLMVLTDNNYYTVALYRAGRLAFKMRFPIRYELLWGMNKREAENAFYTDLMHFNCPEQPEPETLSAAEADGLVQIAESVYVLPGESYLLDEMNSNRFYTPTAAGEYRPLCNAAQPEESVRNLFLTSSGAAVTAVVKQRLYNRRTLDFEVPLHRLLTFCRTVGCRTFVGIETLTDKEVTGTVVLYNPSYGYCHQLYFDMVPPEGKQPFRCRISMELYAYVPTHNISSLFYELQDK